MRIQELQVSERNLNLYVLRKEGKTFAELGEIFNISRSRAYAVYVTTNRRLQYKQFEHLAARVGATA